MTLTTSYLTTTKNLEGILSAIQIAQAPDKFTTRFLESLGYKTAADRLVIGVLKGLGFLDDASVPTDRYYRFLDQTEAWRVLAEGIREAYDDLFRVNTKANQLNENEVKNKLRTLMQGQKSDGVLDDMAKTFAALANLADWSVSKPAQTEEILLPQRLGEKGSEYLPSQKQGISLGQLCYNIQINLPVTRDSAVYEAIFKSLKEHLL